MQSQRAILKLRAMGTGSSSEDGRPGNLVLRLGSSIPEALRPSKAQMVQAWEAEDPEHSGLSRQRVLRVINRLLEEQLEAASAAASHAKLQVAKEQARMEKVGRRERADLRSMSAEAAQESLDRLDRCTAVMLGCAAGPVMAGMMAGYVDIPVTCLTAMLQDKELLQLRVDALFKLHGEGAGAEAKLRLEDFQRGYLGCFDRASTLLSEACAPPTEEQPSPSASTCCLS